MRYLKLTLGFIGILISVQTLPAFYHSSQFDDFVKREVKRPRTRWTVGQITPAILLKAGEYSVPVKAEDIDISTNGGVVRVEVNYRIPIDLLVYSPEMRFRTIGGAWLAE